MIAFQSNRDFSRHCAIKCSGFAFRLIFLQVGHIHGRQRRQLALAKYQPYIPKVGCSSFPKYALSCMHIRTNQIKECFCFSGSTGNAADARPTTWWSTAVLGIKHKTLTKIQTGRSSSALFNLFFTNTFIVFFLSKRCFSILYYYDFCFPTDDQKQYEIISFIISNFCFILNKLQERCFEQNSIFF